jgi:uncharacterized hydrophobic protein (TIGR00341 family)
MALRLMEILLPPTVNGFEDLLREQPIIRMWPVESPGGSRIFRILLQAEHAESVLDLLDSEYGDLEDFRVILLDVQATLPRLESPEEASTANGKKLPRKNGTGEKARDAERISRQELYDDLSCSAAITNVYLVAVVLSSLVATVGIVTGNVAVIIGAMVIAPLLGPNVALSLATTLGDLELGRRSLKASLVGVGIALLSAFIFGLIFQVNPSLPEIASRTTVEPSDVVLALASGASGVLAFTTGISAALIGVMVAVALLPPLVACGLLLGSGHLAAALGAALLVAVNVICVNLAGVVTFLIQGVHPRTWWEASVARRSTRNAISIWIVVLAILMVLAYWIRVAPQ